jgi:hypothetical protein
MRRVPESCFSESSKIFEKLIFLNLHTLFFLSGSLASR